MKKFLSILLTLILTLGVSLVFVGCDNGGEGEQPRGPIYAEEFTYNETHHWRNQINGTGTYEYGVHREESGWCKVCKMYYECPNLRYNKVKIRGVEGYEVVEYDELYESEAILNVEIPKYHQEEGDAEPLPVISIKDNVFNCSENNHTISTSIQSIKLNEGLLSIGSYAFAGSSIKELIIPDSVFGNYRASWYNYGITTVAYNCTELKKVVIGNGVTVLAGYNFLGCINLSDVTFGNSIKEIRPRNFYAVPTLDYLVIPESLVSIPEDSILVPTIGFYQRLVGIASCKAFYFEISEAEYNARVIPAKKRDLATGAIIAPDSTALTTWGFSEGWDGEAQKYFKGEWHYNEKGEPVPNN